MRNLTKCLVTLLTVTTIVLGTAGCASTKEANSNETAPKVETTITTQEPQVETTTKEEPKVEQIPIVLTMNYPIAVGGPLTEKIQKICDDFHALNPNITVNPVYCGSYAETTTRTLTSVQGNDAPDIGVLFSTDLNTFKDLDAVLSLDELIKGEKDGFIDDYYDAFMDNAIAENKVWSIPFQRSTILCYYNKDAFRAAGLDPEVPPTTWEKLVEYSQALTVKEGDTVTQWGLEIPSTGYQYWMFQALALQSGKNLMNPDGTQLYLNSDANKEALQFWCDLGNKYQVMPSGIIEWKTVPTDFLEGKTAMMYHSSGNLSNIKANATFDYGVAMLPANKTYGSPTGGGNLYIFKDIPEENQKAAWEFIKYATSPDVAAQWSIDTGYVAVTKSAWETTLLKDYLKDFPEAEVAKKQLEYAAAELSTHNNPEMTQNVNDIIQAALNGEMTVDEALVQGQEVGDDLLKSFQ